MDEIVSLCKRRGFIFQNSEIYGGQNGFWVYGPLGAELKRNVREAWYHDMVRSHDELSVPRGAPQAFQMVSVETSIIMHPQVWKCSGHYDLFADMMVDCHTCKGRWRVDHLRLKVAFGGQEHGETALLAWAYVPGTDSFGWSRNAAKLLRQEAARRTHDAGIPVSPGEPADAVWSEYVEALHASGESLSDRPVRCPNRDCRGELTEPREFNLMFETHTGAIRTDENKAFLRPETAQGIFVNFRNVCDSTRVKVPFGIAQVGKSFRNEITPRNFTFRSREFEQMEIEFFCHPDSSQDWYRYWRDRRMNWYVDLGLAGERLQLREHAPDELSHYSTGTADVEYAFPFLDAGEFGELEGVAHRGDFDLRSHMEGKLDENTDPLELELDADGKPKWRGSGKDLSYRDNQSGERFVPHVIEPSAGADRATLAFICEAWCVDEQPDDKGNLKPRTVMQFHPRLAPIKVAVFPLIKKEGMPEKAIEVYRELTSAGISAFYHQQGAIGRRYRGQDEIGTPWCVTIDGDTATDGTVTLRDRDSLEQLRIPAKHVVDEIQRRLKS